MLCTYTLVLYFVVGIVLGVVVMVYAAPNLSLSHKNIGNGNNLHPSTECHNGCGCV